MNSLENEAIKSETCPKCGAGMPVYASYVTWCDRCNWNVQPQKREQTLSLRQSMYVKLGERMSRGLFERVMALPIMRPTLTFSKVLAFMIAGIVHSITLLFVVLGLFLWVRSWPYLFPMILPVVCFLVAWGSRPRFEKMPRDILPREKYPALYRLVDTISEVLGGKKVEGIVVTPHFNAAFTEVGFSRKAIVYIGLPLFWVLEDQERVALLAHELAHGVNGDPSRGWFIGSAINALLYWHDLVRPEGIWVPVSLPIPLVDPIASLLMVPVNISLIVLSKLILLAAYGLMYLVFRDTQRAEYLADHLAASVSSTSAVLSTLSKLYLSESVEMVIQRVAIRNRKENLFEAIRRHIAQIPERELERLRRANLLENERIDVTHPPTAYRVELLMKRPLSERRVILPAYDLENIDAELKALEEPMQARVVDEYLTALY